MGSDSTFARGDRVDRFEIDELIAEGGMGAVYRAVDTKLRRTVALKVVRADRLDSTGGEQARQRFLHEALAISKVDHRNVVRVLDFGFSDGTPYLAMEYLRGRDLAKLVKATPGFLPVAYVIDVMLGVCAAIRACHDAGIIHRDLKPSNIFLCEGDDTTEVKILDFGVSKPPLANDLTRTGQIVGTPQYLAPEQIDGKAVPQTDQYAIGVVLYVCLTKSLPYQNLASFVLLRAIGLGKFPPPRELRADLPEKLEAVILRAMRVVPEERFESVHALGRALWEFASAGAREQWRAYYADERLRAPPKASTHGMPLVEAMALGLPAEAPASDPVGFAATAPATPDSAPTPEPTAPVVTAPSIEPLPPPPSTAAPPSGGSARTRWRPVALVGGGALALVIGGWFATRPPNRVEPPPTIVPAVPTAPTAPVAPVAPVVPIVPATVPPPAPAQHEKKRHRRNERKPSAEQTSDGVPIMP